MKRFAWILTFFVAFASGTMLYATTKMTLATIQFDTPKKKYKGVSTEVGFTPKTYAEGRAAKQCEKFHE